MLNARIQTEGKERVVIYKNTDGDKREIVLNTMTKNKAKEIERYSVKSK